MPPSSDPDLAEAAVADEGGAAALEELDDPARAFAELDLLRGTLTALESRQKQQERQLTAWRRGAAAEAAASAVREGVLAAEASQLEHALASLHHISGAEESQSRRRMQELEAREQECNTHTRTAAERRAQLDLEGVRMEDRTRVIERREQRAEEREQVSRAALAELDVHRSEYASRERPSHDGIEATLFQAPQ